MRLVVFPLIEKLTALRGSLRPLSFVYGEESPIVTRDVKSSLPNFFSGLQLRDGTLPIRFFNDLICLEPEDVEGCVTLRSLSRPGGASESEETDSDSLLFLVEEACQLQMILEGDVPVTFPDIPSRVLVYLVDNEAVQRAYTTKTGEETGYLRERVLGLPNVVVLTSFNGVRASEGEILEDSRRLAGLELYIQKNNLGAYSLESLESGSRLLSLTGRLGYVSISGESWLQVYGFLSTWVAENEES